MANPEHLEILARGIEVWNKWRETNPTIQPNLAGAELANGLFRNVNLGFANCNGTNLREANLTAASLFSTNLTFANLRDTNLTRSHLFSTNLEGALLERANFTDAVIGSVTFSDVNLSRVIGLETITHMAPSSIDVRALYRSKGKIPKIFLRGCGVPDDMIEFAHSIAASPIEFNSCFISYSTKDQEFAERLYNDLQGSGVRCWFAPHDIQGGKKVHEQIDWAIHFHDRTLLILSPDSINSAWVKTEIAKARRREIEESRQILFPIRLVDFETLKKWQYFDGDTGTDHAKEIREYFIPDFSNWKDHDSYQNAFKDLLRDLKNERTKAAP